MANDKSRLPVNWTLRRVDRRPEPTSKTRVIVEQYPSHAVLTPLGAMDPWEPWGGVNRKKNNGF